MKDLLDSYEGEPDDAYCAGDDKYLASVDLELLPELEARMALVTNKDEAKAFYDELAEH